ncbi:hypothetical protein CFP56_024016 [Quercus suber]|uniref:Uncharacterized protein n=1 Tax=Quercus suber TaxID=58331 RepID=A0AAW0KAQ5_QUESU
MAFCKFIILKKKKSTWLLLLSDSSCPCGRCIFSLDQYEIVQARMTLPLTKYIAA